MADEREYLRSMHAAWAQSQSQSQSPSPQNQTPHHTAQPHTAQPPNRAGQTKVTSAEDELAKVTRTRTLTLHHTHTARHCTPLVCL